MIEFYVNWFSKKQDRKETKKEKRTFPNNWYEEFDIHEELECNYWHFQREDKVFWLRDVCQNEKNDTIEKRW
jgi:hypothetical protein